MENYQRLAHIMPKPEQTKRWECPTKQMINTCIISSRSDATTWTETIHNFLSELKNKIDQHQEGKKIRINREYVPTEIEEIIAVACKCIGWRMQCRKNHVAIFAYKPNTQKSWRRIKFEIEHSQLYKKKVVM